MHLEPAYAHNRRMSETRVTDFDLQQVRREIDDLDRQIIQLIAERQEWVIRAGSLKKNESAVRAPDRVEQVIAKVRGLADAAEASPDVVEVTYRVMIDAFINLELDEHRKA